MKMDELLKKMEEMSSSLYRSVELNKKLISLVENLLETNRKQAITIAMYESKPANIN